MASEDQSVPSPDSPPKRPARRWFSPGLGLAALLGMLSWAFALWIGPWIAPAPRASVAVPAPVDHESALDPMRSVMALVVPEAPQQNVKPEPIVRSVAVRRGDTLMGVLTRAKVDRDDAHAAITALRKVFNPRDLVAGTQMALSFQPLSDKADATISFRGLEFSPSITETIGVRRTWDNTFEGYLSKTKLTHEPTRAAGTIDNSLYVDSVRAGVPAPVIVELIRAMSFDVDFQRDIQPDDRFDLVYEKVKDADGTVVGSGDILYAALTLSGKELPIYRFRMKDGTWDYFNANGQSTRKALMRTPVDGARLSSRFGRRRHPILGYTKVHKGIDFAAPTGTPIMAAGNGVVAEARWYGGYGRYIRIRHNATYATAYAHLSRFARGIRRGARVRQGQIIGYIGSTGRSTGPHLHYEVHRNNRQVNPLSVKLPTGKTLHGAERERFMAARDEIDGMRARLAPVAAAEPKKKAKAAKDKKADSEPLGTGGP